jgi:serine/threonine protein kinase
MVYILYIIISCTHTMLGKGSYGEVCKISKYGLTYALKTCFFSDSDEANADADPNQVMACLREETMNLKHPNIIHCFWTRWLSNRFQKAMEVGVPVSKAPYMQILHDVAQALHCLHSHGFIHRDVKPENIVEVNGVYKLVDFGLCRKGKFQHTMTGYTISRWFRPPELLHAHVVEVYDGRVDMYSLGVTAWFFETGTYLFHGTEDDIFKSYMNFKPTGVYKNLICDYSVRYTSEDLLKFLKAKPQQGEELELKKRDSKTQLFTEFMIDGEIDRAYDLVGGDLRLTLKKL